MCSRSAYDWTDFGEQAAVSLGYCRGGRKLLVFLVLLDPSGVTATGGGITVIHQPEHQLPIAVVTFEHPAYARHPAAAAMAQQPQTQAHLPQQQGPRPVKAAPPGAWLRPWPILRWSTL